MIRTLRGRALLVGAAALAVACVDASESAAQAPAAARCLGPVSGYDEGASEAEARANAAALWRGLVRRRHGEAFADIAAAQDGRTICRTVAGVLVGCVVTARPCAPAGASADPGGE